MEMRQLSYFVEVVKQGGVTQAAHVLHMSQPPITRQLHLLEEELGCQLFERTGRYLTLTEAGKQLYERALMILGLCDATKDYMASFEAGEHGTLRLGVVSSLEESLFTPHLLVFSEKYPDISFEISNANTYQLLDKLHQGHLEIAFVRTPFSDSSLTSQVLAEDYLVAIGQKKFFIDNVNKPLLVYRRWQKVIESFYQSRGHQPWIRCCSDTAQTTLSLAKSGLGVAIVPVSAIPESLPSSLHIEKLDESFFASKIVMVCLNPTMLSPCAKHFWQEMTKTKKKDLK